MLFLSRTFNPLFLALELFVSYSVFPETFFHSDIYSLMEQLLLPILCRALVGIGVHRISALLFIPWWGRIKETDNSSTINQNNYKLWSCEVKENTGVAG